MALSLLWGPLWLYHCYGDPLWLYHCYGGPLWFYHYHGGPLWLHGGPLWLYQCMGALYGFVTALGTLYGFITAMGAIYGFFTATCTGAHTSFFDPGPKICLCSPDHTSLLRRRPYGSLTDLVPKQIIGQTLVEIYIYVIHFSRLYFHFYITTISLPFLYTQSLQQKLRVASTP